MSNDPKSIIRVLVVDDSPVKRALITHIINSDPQLKVIATASNGEEAIAAVENQKPDIVTMDFHMPKLNGLEATAKIMETYPLPVIIISTTVAKAESTGAVDVMEAGAVGVVQTPVGIYHPDYQQRCNELIEIIKAMAEVKVIRRWPKPVKKATASPPLAIKKLPEIKHPPKLIAIGASTGGPAALKAIFSKLPENFSIPILIVQHIASGFTQGLVDWLSDSTGYKISVAKSGDRPLPAHAYVAPDDYHMKLSSTGRIELIDAPAVNGHKPSVSVLFSSLLKNIGPNLIGILLSGMGKDGAYELKLIKEHGGLTLVQSKESSVVYGMPGVAVDMKAHSMILAPEEIAALLCRLVES